jgi:hypothetical protein
MALTQEQLNRIEELKANKAEFVKTRSRILDSKSRGQNILNNLQNYWDNALGIDSSPLIPKTTWALELRSEFFEDVDSDNVYYNKLFRYLNDIYNSSITKKYNAIIEYINNSSWTTTDKDSLKSTLETTLDNL